MNTAIPTKYTKIYDYWNSNVCRGGNRKFPFHLYKDKEVLEIGCGAGFDAIQFIKAGADYTGIDLTENAIITAQDLILPHLTVYDNAKLMQMNAEHLSFSSNSFDLVYSFGTIHHTLKPYKVVKEIYRVLKPNSEFYVMLYSKPSIRYNLDIMFLRKILWKLHYPKYNKIRQETPAPNPREWVSLNTDTLGCPLSRVYTKKWAKKLFSGFANVKSYTTNYGWFRVVIGRKSSSSAVGECG